jgi:tetratricopeptide (TPR) repeat protein
MLNNLAVHLTGKGDTDRAIRALKIIIEVDDTAPQPHDNLARIYVDRGEPALAKEHFLRALEIAPFDRNVLLGLRALYDSLGEMGESMKVEQRIRTIERKQNLTVE